MISHDAPERPIVVDSRGPQVSKLRGSHSSDRDGADAIIENMASRMAQRGDPSGIDLRHFD